jgi:putative permease
LEDSVEQPGVTASDLRKTVLFAALVYLALRSMAIIASIVLLFTLIGLVSLILTPVVSWLERRRIPRGVSAVTLAFAVLGLFALLGWLVLRPAREEFADLLGNLPAYVEAIRQRISAYGIEVPEVDTIQVLEAVAARDSLLPLLSTYTLNVVTALAGVLLFFLGLIYAVAQPRPLVEMLIKLFRPGQRERATQTIQRIGVQMRRWAIATAASMFVVFLVTWIVLGPILKIPYAFLFAVVAGVFEIVPVIGPIAAALPPVMVGFGQGFSTGIWVVVAFILIQQLESNVIVPLIMAGGLELHPVTVVFVMTAMGLIFGFIGILVAVPVLITLRAVILELYFDDKDQERVQEQVERVVSGDKDSAADDQP